MNSNINNNVKYSYRNSFDFLELESSHLLEMTGDRYNTLVSNSKIMPPPFH